MESSSACVYWSHGFTVYKDVTDLSMNSWHIIRNPLHNSWSIKTIHKSKCIIIGHYFCSLVDDCWYCIWWLNIDLIYWTNKKIDENNVSCFTCISRHVRSIVYLIWKGGGDGLNKTLVGKTICMFMYWLKENVLEIKWRDPVPHTHTHTHTSTAHIVATTLFVNYRFTSDATTC